MNRRPQRSQRKKNSEGSFSVFLLCVLCGLLFNNFSVFFPDATAIFQIVNLGLLTIAVVISRMPHGRLAADSTRIRIVVCSITCGLIFLAAPIATRAAETASSPPSRAELDNIKRQAEQVLARPEFRRVREKRVRPRETPHRTKPQQETPPEKPREKKEKPVEQQQPPAMPEGASALGAGLSQLLLIAAYALLAAVAVGIVWFLFQRIQFSHTKVEKTQEKFDEGEVGTAPGEVAADEYLRRAAELARQGNYREAIAQLVLGAKSHTERQSLIRFRQGLTHRDYLRALRPRPQQHSAFRNLVGVYEPICFGRRPANSEQYQASISEYEGGFGDA